MKKFLPIILGVVIAATAFTGCAAPAAKTPAPAATPAAAAPAAPAAAAAAPSAVKTGIGVVTTIASSKPATADKAGTAQVDSVIAAVTLDGSGKIVKCVIESAQTKIPFNAKGEITAPDLKAKVATKTELGEKYGMKAASKIGKEWNEQAKAFSDWTIGKTVADVKGLKVKKVDDAHPQVPDVAELASSVTVSVGDFIEAIDKAVANAK